MPNVDASAPAALAHLLTQPLRKVAGSFDRAVAVEATAALIPELRRRYGITSVRETTELDCIGIPTMCAVVPDSPDAISVYNGKGPTREQALCSAVMEAVERQAATTVRAPKVSMRPVDVEDGLDLGALGVLEAAWTRETPFVEAYDILNDRSMLVPAAAVQCPWDGEPVFAMTSTHGLASGNHLAEAVLHALFEYVERHLWAIAHTKGHVRPRLLLEKLAASLGEEFDRSAMVDDPAGVEVIFPTGHAVLDAMADRICAVGLSLRLTAVQDGEFPIAMFAHVSDLRVDPQMSHFGMGASWSPTHAAIRAVTEAVQTRAVDIQGSREDLQRVNDPFSGFSDHGRRSTESPHGRWYFDAPCPRAELSELPDRSSDDVVEDIRQILTSFRSAGVRCVAVADLSPSDLPVAVARVIVPDLESAFVDGRIGPRVAALLSGTRPTFQ